MLDLGLGLDEHRLREEISSLSVRVRNVSMCVCEHVLLMMWGHMFTQSHYGGLASFWGQVPIM